MGGGNREIVPFLTNLPHITSDIKINAEGVVVYHGGDAISQPESAVCHLWVSVSLWLSCRT